MTIMIVAAVLLGTACVCGGLLIRKLRKDMERQQANILALQYRTQSIKQADRQRMDSAMNEDRGLVQKLKGALVEKPAPAAPVPRAEEDRGLVRKLHLALVETPPRASAERAEKDQELTQKLLAALGETKPPPLPSTQR